MFLWYTVYRSTVHPKKESNYKAKKTATVVAVYCIYADTLLFGGGGGGGGGGERTNFSP